MAPSKRAALLLLLLVAAAAAAHAAKPRSGRGQPARLKRASAGQAAKAIAAAKRNAQQRRAGNAAPINAAPGTPQQPAAPSNAVPVPSKLSHVDIPKDAPANKPLTRVIEASAPARPPSKGQKARPTTVTVPARFIVQVSAQPAAAAMGEARSAARAARAAAATTSGASDAAPSSPPAATSAAVEARTSAVTAQVDRVAASAGVSSKVVRRFSRALSGFVVSGPTPKELRALAADPTVTSIWPVGVRSLQTFSSPEFLGLTGPAAPTGHDSASDSGYHHEQQQYVWDKLGGVLGPDGAGEDVVIGVLDTGIWMEGHPSFADSSYWATAPTNQGQFYAPLRHWKGQCEEARDGTPFPCNNKVVGCRWYPPFTDAEMAQYFPNDPLACTDAQGHGSHTASTAGGNYGAESPGAPPGALLSGMAPRARLAMYKVCWGGRDSEFEGCWDDGIVGAIEDAILDGVHIISYSIGGPAMPTFEDPISMAWLNAAKAGVFVSASAGNSGPEPATIGSNVAPWITVVASSTQPRQSSATVLLGSGSVRLTGSAPGMQHALGPAPLIYGADAALDGMRAYAALCAADSMDPALVAGKIVVCDSPQGRIGTAVDGASKAGALAVIISVLPQSPYQIGRETNINGFPYVELLADQRSALFAYLWSTPRPTASFAAAAYSHHHTAPQVSGFSSRGPATEVKQLVLKPDIAAPGQMVHAAVTPIGEDGPILYNTYMGTSMAAPHISGIAALLLDKYPDWPPSAIQSAMMTSSYQLTKTGDAGQPFGNAFDYGAGEVSPAAAMHPGLVIMSNSAEWDAFLCSSKVALNGVIPDACGGAHEGAGKRGGSNGKARRQAVVASRQEQQQHEFAYYQAPDAASTDAAAAAAFLDGGYGSAGLGGGAASVAASVAHGSSGDAAALGGTASLRGSAQQPYLVSKRVVQQPRVAHAPAPSAPGHHHDAPEQHHAQHHEQQQEPWSAPPPQQQQHHDHHQEAAYDAPPAYDHDAHHDAPHQPPAEKPKPWEPEYDELKEAQRYKSGEHNEGAPDAACVVHAAQTNSPSISGILGGATTFSRVLTAVLPASGHGDYSYGGAPGGGRVAFEATATPTNGSSFSIEVWPREFEAADGEQVTVYITLTARADTHMGVPQTGEVVWCSADKEYRVVVPIGVTFHTLAAPSRLWVNRTMVPDGSAEYTYRVSTAVSDVLDVVSTGFVQPETGELPANATHPAVFQWTVSPEPTYAAIALFAADYPPGTDLDLFIYREINGELELISASTMPTGYDDIVEFNSPQNGLKPGEYIVAVTVWPPTSSQQVTAKPYAWAIFGDEYDVTGPAQLEVTPHQLHADASDPCCCHVTLSMTNLNDPPGRYIALVDYVTVSGVREGRTVIWDGVVQ